MSFGRKKNISLVELIMPEDSTPVGAAMASTSLKPCLANRTFATAKVMLWTGMSFILSVGISQLQ
ncbi:hypothetical protein [Pseudodesulfovibrio senegalensis]|uniref:Uncharacterized protein n=1 Tax=Pseudodesulfovibrio senegalensis TaxID=1721087 RepID=A0A6N6N6F5_9BACT|nr:hypothetical protein [Pseudodesulfovibrio senegalensis]KAB1442697.1 hypothetical protein F8A88_00005 [Pseudodesulfovibrio senegalensis]